MSHNDHHAIGDVEVVVCQIYISPLGNYLENSMIMLDIAGLVYTRNLKKNTKNNHLYID
jgi:hypothetical protein